MSANEIGLIESTVIAARSFGHKLALIPSVLIALRMWGTIRFFILLSVVYSSSATYDETLTDVDKVLLVLQVHFSDTFRILVFIASTTDLLSVYAIRSSPGTLYNVSDSFRKLNFLCILSLYILTAESSFNFVNNFTLIK